MRSLFWGQAILWGGGDSPGGNFLGGGVGAGVNASNTY